MPSLFLHEHDNNIQEAGRYCYPDHSHFHQKLYPLHENEYIHSLIQSAADNQDACVKGTSLDHDDTAVAAPFYPLRLRRPPPRPLMATMTFSRETSGMVNMDAPPGSPPDLTNSNKSSKSSSLHSSSLSDMIGPNDISHFEDIVLDDLHAALPSDFYHPYANGLDHGRPVAARSSVTSFGSNRSSAHAMNAFRDLTTSGAKPRYPSLKGQVSNVVRGPPSNLNAPRQLRRGFSSPSTPSLSDTHNQSTTNGRRSPSPSSAHSQVYSTSPRSLSRRSSRSNLEVFPSNFNHNKRRQSWQPGQRKTVKEREAECDDQDDELPEDAIIWGVPVSPRPAHERSLSHSPQPASPALHPVGVKHSSAPAVLAATASPSLSSPLHMTHNGNENAPPGSQQLTKSRTQSWHSAYMSLDPDAKALTAALEAYQEEAEREQEDKVQNGGSPRPSQEALKSTTSAVELPPIRKGDPLIDPLGVSKEKMKVLSRTRPSWLPPKDKKEERKHIKEYQEMMLRVKEAQQKEAAKAKAAQERRERIQVIKSRVWEQHILPRWDHYVLGPGFNEVRQVWWQGIPPQLRGQVWARAIGNDLALTENSYLTASRNAKEAYAELARKTPEEREGDSGDGGELLWECFCRVQELAGETFPEVGLFGKGAPLGEDLVEVCMAYAMYRRDCLRRVPSVH
ncbi:hypothetical protein K432DRAFT_446477, partial [Lepidopterella palustris CBS 459.81]